MFCQHRQSAPQSIPVDGAAQRDAWILDVRGASRDHPVLMAMPETAYLKNVTLKVF